jgi:hypothetical protein
MQVSVAVLLDNFVTVSMRMENDDKKKALKEKKASSHFQNPLEPLIAKLANEYTDSANLTAKIASLFHVGPLAPAAALRLPCLSLARLGGRFGSHPVLLALAWPQILDSNGSGGLTSQEFCAAMKKLVPLPTALPR